MPAPVPVFASQIWQSYVLNGRMLYSGTLKLCLFSSFLVALANEYLPEFGGATITSPQLRWYACLLGQSTGLGKFQT